MHDQIEVPSLHATSPTIQLARQHFHLLMQRSREGGEEAASLRRTFANCVECKAIDEGYMLKPSVWSEIHTVGKDVHLCLECAERKLGRKFTLHDFADATINSTIFFGAGLVEDSLIKSYKPIRFKTHEILGFMKPGVYEAIECPQCGYEHTDLEEEDGVVCICGNVFHNTGGHLYMFTYVNPQTGSKN